jgi:hypothetical protein
MRNVSKQVKRALNEWGEYGDHRGPNGKDIEDDEEWLRLCDMADDLLNDWRDHFETLPIKLQTQIKKLIDEDGDFELADSYFEPFANKWILAHRDEYDLDWIDDVDDLNTPMGAKEWSPLNAGQYDL